MTEDDAKTTVYVDVEDDITTIISKVEESAKSVVALVLPKRSAALHSTVNMRLLKQNAESAGKKVVIVTSESALLPLAGAVGLPVAKNLHTAPEIPPEPKMAEPASGSSDSTNQAYATSKTPITPTKPPVKGPNPIATIGALDEAHERKEPETIELDDESPSKKSPATESGPKGGMAGMAGAMAAKIPGIKVPNFDSFRKWLILGGVGLVGLIVFLYFALSVLPKASIVITTDSSPVSLNMNISASGGTKKLDEVNNIIPSTLQTYKQVAKKNITPTGRQDVGSKAIADITLSIPCSAVSSPITISSGTGVSNGEFTYITQSSVTLGNSTPSYPGGVCTFTGSTSIIAQKAGSDYNGKSTFSVSGQPDVSADASQPTSGGSSQIVTVVSQQDLNTALTAISNDTSQPAEADVTKQFQTKLDEQGYYLVSSTLKVSKPVASSSPSVGQQATSATVSVTTTYSVLALKKDDLTKLITNYAKKQIDSAKQTIETTDILKEVKISVASQSSSTDSTLNVEGEVKAIPVIKAEDVINDSAGKKKGDIKTVISGLPGVKSVDIHLSPFWVSKVPGDHSKIRVTIQAAPGAQ